MSWTLPLGKQCSALFPSSSHTGSPSRMETQAVCFPSLTFKMGDDLNEG